MSTAADSLVEQLVAALRIGRANALSASRLAHHLDVSERTVGALAAEACERGWLVGSACSEPVGYFLIRDEEDLRVGIGHIYARAMASLARWRKVKRAAEHTFSEQTVLALFPDEPPNRWKDEGLVGGEATRRMAGLA